MYILYNIYIYVYLIYKYYASDLCYYYHCHVMLFLTIKMLLFVNGLLITNKEVRNVRYNQIDNH